MSKASLVVIFNHRYEKNVPKLEAYYAPRFSSRRYLMPFAQSESNQVIRIIENSHTFSGHIAQGYSRYKIADATHYVFAADDLILNPGLNENNIIEALQLGENAGYIKSLVSADRVRFRWPWAMPAYQSLLKANFDYASELPPSSEALGRFRRLGLEFSKPTPRTLADMQWMHFPAHPKSLKEVYWSRKIIRPYLYGLMEMVKSMGKPSLYPLLAGYSDFIVVPAKSIDLFARYCGIFAALNVFAEVAVPTALALSCDEVQTELLLGDHFSDPKPCRAPNRSLHGVDSGTSRSPHSAARSNLVGRD